MKNNSEVIFIKRENSKRKKLVKILKIVKTESFELDENLLDTSEDFFFLEDFNLLCFREKTNNFPKKKSIDFIMSAVKFKIDE